MAIPEAVAANFDTLQRVFSDGCAAVVETETMAGEPAYVVCAIVQDGDEYQIIPFARMFNGNPYEELKDPATAERQAEFKEKTGATLKPSCAPQSKCEDAACHDSTCEGGHDD